MEVPVPLMGEALAWDVLHTRDPSFHFALIKCYSFLQVLLLPGSPAHSPPIPSFFSKLRGGRLSYPMSHSANQKVSLPQHLSHRQARHNTCLSCPKTFFFFFNFSLQFLKVVRNTSGDSQKVEIGSLKQRCGFTLEKWKHRCILGERGTQNQTTWLLWGGKVYPSIKRLTEKYFISLNALHDLHKSKTRQKEVNVFYARPTNWEEIGEGQFEN